jgi:hypothetical protein
MQEPTIPFLKVLGDNQGTRSKDDFDQGFTSSPSTQQYISHWFETDHF